MINNEIQERKIDEEINRELDEKAPLTTAQRRALPDIAYGYVEPGHVDPETGKSPEKYRHFPHHTRSVKKPTDDKTVNKRLLGLAFQLGPRSSFWGKAEGHLKGHAQRLGLEYGEGRSLELALLMKKSKIMSKDDENAPRLIEGYASVDMIDRQGETIKPEAFRTGMIAYSRNPIILYNHDSNRPVGRMVDWGIDDTGLWIQVEVARGVPDADLVWSLIEQGVLNAFSVCTVEQILRNEDDVNVIERWDLAEISIVTVPANAGAIFHISEDKRALKFLKSKEELTMSEKNTEGQKPNQKPEDNKPLVDIEAIVAKAISGLSTKIEALTDKKGANNDGDDGEKENKENVEKLQTELTEQKDQIKTLTDQIEKFQKIPINAGKIPFPDGSRITIGDKFARRGLKSLTDLYLLNQILVSSGKTPSSELQKALDTATSDEGADYIATALASEIWATIHLDAKIAPLFTFLEMPTDPYKLPVDSTLPEMFYVGESLVYNASDFPENAPATGYKQLDAKKFVIHCMYSGELDEDSIIPVLPFIRSQLVTSALHGIDNVILNGDTVATATGNINLDDAEPESTKNYLSMDGLRKLALVTNTANKSADASIATLTAAGFNLLRGLMVNWGITPSDLAFIVDVGTYLKAVALTEVKTVDQYGSQATILMGELAKIFGIPIIVSEEMSKTEADGKVCKTPASNTKGQICLVNRRGWLGGWRRKLKIETERIIATDQYRIVGTLRFALINFDTEVSAVGYNITV